MKSSKKVSGQTINTTFTNQILIPYTALISAVARFSIGKPEHDEALQQVRLDMPEAGSGALVEAGLIMAARPIGQRQEALSRWHEFFESDKKTNASNGYPSGHPKSRD